MAIPVPKKSENYYNKQKLKLSMYYITIYLYLYHLLI